MRIAVGIAAAWLATTTLARAETLNTAEPRPAERRAAKSTTIALALPLGATVAGMGMFVLGDYKESCCPQGWNVWDVPKWGGAALAFAGPSLGRVYVNRPLSIGLAARLVGGSLVLIGYDRVFASGDDTRSQRSVPLALGGFALMTGGAVYDIVTARTIARESADAGAVQIGFAPLPRSSGEGATFAVAGSF